MDSPFLLETELGKMVFREAFWGRLTLTIRLKNREEQGKFIV
jgi:hypothetical protein